MAAFYNGGEQQWEFLMIQTRLCSQHHSFRYLQALQGQDVGCAVQTWRLWKTQQNNYHKSVVGEVFLLWPTSSSFWNEGKLHYCKKVYSLYGRSKTPLEGFCVPLNIETGSYVRLENIHDIHVRSWGKTWVYGGLEGSTQMQIEAQKPKWICTQSWWYTCRGMEVSGRGSSRVSDSVVQQHLR